jgi:aquaporin Z
MRGTLRPLAAEFLGTFGFVFIGAALVVVDTMLRGAYGPGLIAIGHGVALAVLVTATMRVSGGHLNPAVTFALWTAGRIDLRKTGLYIVTQLIAAVIAALAVRWLLPSGAVEAASVGVPRIAGEVDFTKAVLLEGFLTLILVSAVFGTCVSRHAPQVGGFGIGLVLVFAILVGGPLTGAALNPARAFGPAVVSGDWYGHLAYWLGPLLGAAAAAFIWAKLLLPMTGDPEP